MRVSQTASPSPPQQNNLPPSTRKAGHLSGSIQEFRNTENMMSSGKKSKKQRKRDEARIEIHDDLSHPTSPIQRLDNGRKINGQEEDPDEIEEIDAYRTPKGQSKAPTRKSHIPTTHVVSQRGYVRTPGDTTSPFWPTTASGTRSTNSGLPVKPELSVVVPPMNEQFVGVDGRKRGANPSSSPDELSMGTTVGRHAQTSLASPHKRQRIDKPAKQSIARAMRPDTDQADDGLEPSHFNHTQFSGQATTQSRMTEEAPASWAVQLSAINLPEADEYAVVSDAALEYDEKKKLYNILQAGRTFHRDGVLGIIARGKLRKVYYEKKGTKIRFESAQSEGLDHIIEIELSHKKDVLQLLDHLQQSRACQCIEKEGFVTP